MSKNYSFSFMLIIILLTGCARPVLDGNREERDIRIKKLHKGKVTIPFELINNLIVVPVKLNNSDKLKFVLDTGAGQTVITELGPAQSFNIRYQSNIRLNGLGITGSIPALLSRGNEIFMEGVEGDAHTVVFVLEGRFNLSYYMGTQINGLLGYDIFENFIVEVDYERKRLYLHDPDAFEEEYNRIKRDESWTYIPAYVLKNKLYIDIDITQNDNSIINARLLVDSGASSSVFLYPNERKEVIIPSNSIESYLGTGLSGEIHGRIGRVKKLKIGDTEIENPIIAYPHFEAVEQAISTDQRDGSIGADLLKRFDIIYNYRGNGILVRPNGNLKDPFRYNRSGIEVITPILDLPYYVISEIRPNSPADIVGLQRDDVIKEVNFQNVFHYSLDRLLEVLYSAKKNKMNIHVLRGEEELNFSINIDDAIQLKD